MERIRNPLVNAVITSLLAIASSAAMSATDATQWFPKLTLVSCGQLAKFASEAPGQSLFGPIAAESCAGKPDSNLVRLNERAISHGIDQFVMSSGSSLEATRAANQWRSDLWAENNKWFGLLVRAASRKEIPPFTLIAQDMAPEKRSFRVAAFVELMRPYVDTANFEPLRAHALSSYRETGLQTSDAGPTAILTCVELARHLGDMPVVVAERLEPVFANCYLAANKPLEFKAEDFSAQLSSAGLNQDKISNISRIARSNVRAAQDVHRTYLAHRKREEDRLAEVQRYKDNEAAAARRRADQAAKLASAERQAKEREAAEQARWASLTPQQRAAENQAAEEQERRYTLAWCENAIKFARSAYISGDFSRLNNIRRQMLVKGCPNVE